MLLLLGSMCSWAHARRSTTTRTSQQPPRPPAPPRSRTSDHVTRAASQQLYVGEEGRLSTSSMDVRAGPAACAVSVAEIAASAVERLHTATTRTATNPHTSHKNPHHIIRMRTTRISVPTVYAKINGSQPQSPPYSVVYFEIDDNAQPGAECRFQVTHWASGDKVAVYQGS